MLLIRLKYEGGIGGSRQHDSASNTCTKTWLNLESFFWMPLNSRYNQFSLNGNRETFVAIHYSIFWSLLIFNKCYMYIKLFFIHYLYFLPNFMQLWYGICVIINRWLADNREFRGWEVQSLLLASTIWKRGRPGPDFLVDHFGLSLKILNRFLLMVHQLFCAAAIPKSLFITHVIHGPGSSCMNLPGDGRPAIIN